MTVPTRIDRVRALLIDRGLDAVIITSSTNRRFLSGFSAEDHAPDESSGIAVIGRDRAWLFTSPTNLPWAQAETSSDFEVLPSQRIWAASVATLATAEGWSRIGFEDRTTVVANYHSLLNLLGDGISVSPLESAIDTLRAVKDGAELDLLRAAAKMTDEAFVAAESQIRVGQSEREIAALIQDELRRLGSEGEAFNTIVASGPNAAKPHHFPGDRLVQEGEPIIIDMGAVVEGYRGDLTRTIWLGQASEQLGTIYQAVVEAHAMAIPLYRAGANGGVIDRTIRGWFSEQGFGELFLHGLGHGLGLRIHEAPSVGPTSTDTLEQGNVVSVEPGLYIADWGGVRIENIVAVTDGDPEDLTRAPIRTMK